MSGKDGVEKKAADERKKKENGRAKWAIEAITGSQR